MILITYREHFEMLINNLEISEIGYFDKLGTLNEIKLII
jgi:hypothetical protein